MANSPVLGLPYLAAAQAQKHVTVNEGLRRLDALAQLSVASATTAAEPVSPAEGDAYILPASPTGTTWASYAQHDIVAYQDGAWARFAPRAGWRAYVADLGGVLVFDGTRWGGVNVLAYGDHGAGLLAGVVQEDHALTAGATSTPSIQIPNRATVTGVTARVLSAVGGATSFQVGVSGAADRYGNLIGVAQGSTNNGVSGTPTAYYADTSLLLTAQGANFDGTGSLRLAITYLISTVPAA